MKNRSERVVLTESAGLVPFKQKNPVTLRFSGKINYIFNYSLVSVCFKKNEEGHSIGLTL